jgi:hypothetical protein
MHDASGRSDLALARLGSVQDLLRETLEDLDRTGVLGRATVIVLSDHGPRSREVAIARELTANVMLTAFIPGERKDVIVRDPVSLVDIAPTLAVWLGIDLPQSDGVPLPLESGRGPRRRESTGIAMHPSPVDGLDIWQLSADSVRTLLRFHDDDTFSINRPAFSTLMASMPRADRW